MTEVVCPECGWGSVVPWMDQEGNVVWICDELGEVWLQGADVGRWPSYDPWGWRREWVTLDGQTIERDSLHRIVESDLPADVSLPSPGKGLPSQSQNVGYILRLLSGMISDRVPGFDSLGVERFVGEQRFAEAIAMLRHQLSVTAGVEDPYITSYVEQLEKVIARGGAYIPDDWRAEPR